MFTCTRGARGATILTLLLCVTSLAGCARLSSHKPMRGLSAAPSVLSAPRRVSVVSADSAPRIPTTGWQPSARQSIWAGALAGGGAGAGVGAGVCTVSFICPPCYAACVATLGLGGAAVGAFGGRVAHRQMASDPANRMLPAADELSARFRARMLASLSARPGVLAQDGGAAPLPFARDSAEGSRVGVSASATVEAEASSPPPAQVLEIALTQIHAEALRKGGFEVGMQARARLRQISSGKQGEVEEFEYQGKPIAEGGGIEAEAQRVAAEVDHGLDTLANEIRDKLVGDE